MFPRILPATARLFSMSAAGKPPAAIPVIVCGKTSQIGDVVRETLQPEYKVTHLFLSPATAKREIPALLRQGAATSTEQGPPPAAIIIGGGYTQTDLQEIRAACQGLDATPVAWLKVDPRKTPSSIPVGPEYGRAVAKRTKDRLDELLRGEGVSRDEVHFI
ncbi:hypothetical protein BDV26DRAFT_262098 [Aspergillus bertholletiae]|uniref:Uncharacterized protein n=1 Tax=Aspergillus bertholletiae TaxID=1226010 RepID=A0A5N7B8Q3_9EURO|nr:hypothetical protein BDV26DRAFT_262098 [Aspergillus bertholletiae]